MYNAMHRRWNTLALAASKLRSKPKTPARAFYPWLHRAHLQYSFVVRQPFSTAAAYDYDSDYDYDRDELAHLDKRQCLDYLHQLGVKVPNFQKKKAKAMREQLRKKLDQEGLTLSFLDGDDDDMFPSYMQDHLNSTSDYNPDMSSRQDQDEFSKHTVPMLKEELRNRGLKVGGKKAELLERLREHKNNGTDDEPDIWNDTVEDDEPDHYDPDKEYHDIFRRMNVIDIQEELNMRRVSYRDCHDKESLVHRLLQARKTNPLYDMSDEQVKTYANYSEPEPPVKKIVDPNTVTEPTMCVFDKANQYQLSTLESLQDRPDDMLLSPALDIPDEVDGLLGLLPPHLRRSPLLQDQGSQKRDLIEIMLDIGRRPTCWMKAKREFLLGTPAKSISEHHETTSSAETDPPVEGVENPASDSLDAVSTTADASSSDEKTKGDEYVVTQEDLNHVLGGLHFGEDNRAGVERCLHRISGVRNRDGKLIGATLRVGRYVPGNAILIADLLFRTNSSILFVGPPGSAKTSILRDAARILSQDQSVVIVDTSCEIGGAGDIPHDCIGLSRRMQVKNIASQAQVMVECVQNHTPSVIVIDEIGRGAEVQAALTCKERGVRIMASAHGSLPGLVRNAELCELVGGVDVVTIGDKSAQRHAQEGRSGSKLKAERKGPPVFDAVVELQRGHLHEWKVVLQTAKAVDDILAYGKYNAQMRRRHPEGKEAGIEIQNIVSNADLNEIVEEQMNSSNLSLTSAMNKTNQERFDANKTDWDLYMRRDKNNKYCPVCNKELKTYKGMFHHASVTRCRHSLPEYVRQFFAQQI